MLIDAHTHTSEIHVYSITCGNYKKQIPSERISTEDHNILYESICVGCPELATLKRKVDLWFVPHRKQILELAVSGLPEFFLR